MHNKAIKYAKEVIVLKATKVLKLGSCTPLFIRSYCKDTIDNTIYIYISVAQNTIAIGNSSALLF